MISSSLIEQFNLIPSEETGKYFAEKGNPVSASHISIMSGQPVELIELEKPFFNEKRIQFSQEKKSGDKAKVVLTNKTSAINALDLVINQAIEIKASDIHIESVEKGLRIRFRIDGHLIETFETTLDLKDSFLARIKILANLDVAEKRRPQDGRIRFKSQSKEMDLRISIIPVYNGEKVVIRLLDTVIQNLKFSDLGFNEEYCRLIERSLQHNNGLILVTGPTGSGKSTTLYSALTFLNKPDTNILTVEDPIEYQMRGINQSAVKEEIGYTFSQALRSFLRQDPNIIMVGEIRDLDTAEISIRASLTGHLVLSTLHTNDAQSTPYRLIDMGIEPFLLAATLRAVLAQRLIRVLCPSCKKEIKHDDLKENYYLQKFGFQNRLVNSKIFQAVGCPSCRFTGYKGRTLVSQIMIIDDRIKEIISHNKPIMELNQYLETSGQKSLFYNGLEKVISGITSLDEIIKETL